MNPEVRAELDARGLQAVRGYYPRSNPASTAQQVAEAIARSERDIWAGRAFPCVDIDGNLGPVRRFVVDEAEDVFFRLRLSTHRPFGWALAALAKAMVPAKPLTP